MESMKSGFKSPITIVEVVEQIHRKRYLLPSIQRELVWEPDQIIKLFDSLMRNYPIGSFLFWYVEKDRTKDFQFYEFIREFSEKDSTHNPKANITGEQDITAILDGQQRFTSLYLGMKGTYASKLPRKRWDNVDAFPKRKLYLNLLSKSQEMELEYDFRFLTLEEAVESDEKTFWFEVGKVLDFKEPAEVNQYLIDKNINSKPKEAFGLANSLLFKLYNIVNNSSIINFYLETSQELDKVLNIFIRVNSGGTQLSYSDLLLSIATAQWKDKDAREEIFGFVGEINQNGVFSFDKDFVLKSCLVLSDLDVAFKVDNFNRQNMLKIEENWENITKSIRLAVDLVDAFGYNYETLVSGNALIPIAYYLYKLKNPPNFVKSSSYKEDRKSIKEWLAAAFLKRTFSGQPDNVLRPMRELLQDGITSFPLQKIFDKFKGTTKTLLFTDDDIDNLLNYQYNQSHTFTVLSLLYPTLDFKNKFTEDHMFPKSQFRKSRLRNKGIEEEKHEFYLSNFNTIANLQLLEGMPNEEKSAKDFKEWLFETYPNESERREYMKKHHVPLDVNLGLDHFEEFIKKRSDLIKTYLKQILPTTNQATN